MKYNKLVRDGIPEYIKGRGEEAKWHVADRKEYSMKLKEKLVEEAAEFLKNESIEEIADLLEVIETICVFRKFDRGEIEKVRSEKATKQGKFERRIILDES